MIQRSQIVALTLLSIVSLACGNEDDNNETPNDGGGTGQLTAVRSGSLVADGAGGAPDATGSVTISRDSTGALFVTLGEDFMQEAGPGDTQLILAKSNANVSEQRNDDAGNTSPSLATVTNGFAGAAEFALPANVNIDEFSYLIVWCPTAGVNFGAAQLDGGAVAELTEVRQADLVADGPGGTPDATGTVNISRDASGKLYIVLEDDFAQEVGPGDTQLILARGEDNVQVQRDADADNVSPALGTIPNGANGTREFEVPAGVDIDDFDYAIIWCPSAGVNFGVAELPSRSGTLAGDGDGGAPDADGSVSFARDSDGNLQIVLGDDFAQETGPGDTQVILAVGDGNVADQRTTNASNTSESIGTVPNGASGTQSFSIPESVDVDRFDHVIIWCPSAGVNFGVARLN